MKICYIHQYFRTTDMAGSTRSYEFVRRLVAHGHKVDMITTDTSTIPNKSGELWRVTIEAGATIHWAAIPYDNTMTYPQRLKAFGHFAWVAAHRAAGLKCDVVFATSTPLTIAIPGAYAAWRRRVPMILEVRDLWPATPIAVGALRSPITQKAAWALEAWAYRRARHIIALSPDSADNLRTRYPNIPVTVIPNSSDIELFNNVENARHILKESLPGLGDCPMILYAGTLGLINGVSYLANMASSLLQINSDIRIVIVGSGREEKDIRHLAHTLGVLDNNFFMCGPIPKKDISTYFSACDLSVSTVIDVPELFSNSANKVFDTFAAGRPIGINHGGWLADLINETGAGIVFPASDPEKAAHMASDFIGDQSRINKARAASLELARTQFSREHLFKEFESVLHTTISSTLSEHAIKKEY